MIEWRDEGPLIAVRKHGETSVIIEVFTAEHGRHAGVVRGGTSRKVSASLQPGTQIEITWKARLEDHVGSITVEPQRSRAAQVMQDRVALAGLNAVCAILSFSLPEREPHPALYARTVALLDLLGQGDVWPLAYLQWEMALLDELGFGLDLSACAVTGTNADLCFVSPRTGRAVSRENAGPWVDRLLPLSPALIGRDITDENILQGLQTTGHFFENHLAPSLGDRKFPASRARLLDALNRQP